MNVYDDNEDFCVGDPTPEEIDWKAVTKLQKKIDKIEAIENPIVKDKALKAFVRELNGG